MDRSRKAHGNHPPLSAMRDLPKKPPEPVSGSAGVPPASHKHWHSRGYLPHCDTPGLLQAITFRLADALPKDAIARLESERLDEPQKRKRVEVLLDAGHGACWLREPACATIVENALLHFDGARYRLLEWCVMPNHVHVLVETLEGWPLGEIVHSWKSFSAKAINKTRGRTGKVWQADYFDRFIRDERHLAAAREYVRANPVTAGLVVAPAHWAFSSAARTGKDAGETGTDAGERGRTAGETPALREEEG